MQQDTFGEKLYTSTEVAEILGVSLRSIYRYLDENKIQAAVKTATGRHRFTKQNINDFLHPGESRQDTDRPSASQVKPKADEESLAAPETPKAKPEAEAKSTKPSPAKESSESKESKAAPESQEEVADEPIDWLARFRQAAEKYKAQAPEDTDKPRKSETSLTDDQSPVEEAEQAGVEEFAYRYYRSGVGGLKEVAQSLDKSAKNASLDYAFTMSAGLSLHKPIKPFSLIHAYVHSADLPYFEKVLQLTDCQKDTAQLCLISSDDAGLYSGRRELHGLFVVSDEQIKSDLLAEGETELANELD